MEEELTMFVAMKGFHGGIWNENQAGKMNGGESIGEVVPPVFYFILFQEVL